MVEKLVSSSYTEIVYAPTGDKVALATQQTLQKAFISLPGGTKAVYGPSGLVYYRHSDWLRSSRLASTPSRAVYGGTAYAALGETYAQSGSTDFSFTGRGPDPVHGPCRFPPRPFSPTPRRGG